MALLSLLALLVAAAPDVYPHNCTYKQGGTGSVTRACADKLADALAAKEFGAKCDGVTDDAPALALANTAAVAQGKAIFIGCKLRIASAAGTVAAGLRFEGAGALDLSPLGGSVTLTGPLTAPMGQVFFTGSGTLTFSAKVAQVVPQWWGAVGDGVADDTAAIQAAITAVSGAAAGSPKTLKFQKGVFKVTAGIASTGINVIGEGGAEFSGSPATEIDCYAAGICWTFTSSTSNGSKFEGIRLASKAAGQTGLNVIGGFGIIQNIGIREFDTAGLQMGVASVVDADFNDVSNVVVFNPATQGAVGVLVSGGFPSANANHFRNIVVSGRFTHMVEIGGTKNIFLDGDVVPDTQGTGVTAAWYITGSMNEIHGSYTELAVGSAAPTSLVTLTSTTNSNTIIDLQVQYGISTILPNQTISYVDQGWNNRVDVRATGFNSLTVGQNTSGTNLVPNSGFQQWDTSGSGQPLGWVNFAGTFAQDTTTTHGTTTSVKMTGAGTNPNLTGYFVSPSAGDKSLNQIPIGYFLGKQVTCRAWCKSSIAGQGNLRVTTDGTGGSAFGASFHSGSGNWEELTVSALVPTDATKVGLQLRNTNGGGTLTGDIWFSEPECVVGTILPHYAAKPLTDTTAQLMSPLVLAPPTTLTYSANIATDASLGNSFIVTATNGTAFTMLNPSNLKAGQRLLYTFRNTSGGAMGAVGFGGTFKTAAFVGAATGFSRSVEFQYNGANLIQLWQSAADVPN